MMRLVVLVTFAVSSLVLASCSPSNGQCQKEFDCKTELKLDLLNDYVDICSAERDGAVNALNKAADKECHDLATAEIALATCESTLSCDDLAKERSGGDTTCKSFQDDLTKKQTAAAAVNGQCTAVVVDGGEGEGEGAAGGEGEGEGGQ